MISVKDCLKEINITPESLQNCASLSQEFNLIKKSYFQRCLQTHPDKGGNEQDFRLLNSCFEIIRDLFDKGEISTFVGLGSKSFGFANIKTQGFDYYAFGAQEVVPVYMVELARSKRSKCIMKRCLGKDIVKGEISKIVI